MASRENVERFPGCFCCTVFPENKNLSVTFLPSPASNIQKDKEVRMNNIFRALKDAL